MNTDRRGFLKTAGLVAAGAGMLPRRAGAETDGRSEAYDWIRNTRIVIAEGYNPPFYPAFDYEPEKAVSIARELGGDALRYPSAGYYAFFPTKSGYPVHPELKGDPMARTVELCHRQGLKVVAYVPLNHPFMDVTTGNPRYDDWSKKFIDGRPMTTEHYGYATYYEGCLNSPVRGVIETLVREVLTQYPVDVIFFDGPYQGMAHAKDYCHCRYCREAYRKRFGAEIPDQRSKVSREEEIRYTAWMRDEVVRVFFQGIRDMIRRTRDIPVLFNDTSLLSKREWRSRDVAVTDGFMFEAAETPEDKLFNLQLGRSTGKTVWTYVGTHTQYNREHLKSDRVRGWFSYPVESEELLIDGATALAGGAGLVYWGMSRFFYEPKGPLEYAAGKYVKEIFDFQRREDALLRRMKPRPQAGILVGGQTIDWYTGKHFVGKFYENAPHGAFKALKAGSFDAEPFVDWEMSPEKLKRYAMVYAPNAVCLSDAQCGMLREYVRGGGKLVATLLTSAADEHGRLRKDFGLADVFGAGLLRMEPEEIPDLYLKFKGRDEVPQDPQVVRFEAKGAEVVAETFDRGHRKNLGPAIVRQRFGQGEVVYIGSNLDAIYEETHMAPVREVLLGLMSPWLESERRYWVEFRPGLMPHYTEGGRDGSTETVLLHLLANVGDKDKHLRTREGFVAIGDVKLRVRVPAGKTVKRARLLRAGEEATPAVNGGWAELTVPRVFVHEAVQIDFA